MEHHSNIVPWQMLCGEKGARLRVIPINDDGELLLDEFEKLFNDTDETRGRGPRLERPGNGQSRSARSSNGPMPAASRS